MLSAEVPNKLIFEIIGYKKGMITTLPELNGQGVKIGGTEPLNHIILILLQQPPINLLLLLGHLHINNHLIQLGNGLLNIFLNPPQQVGFK
jgi:hypothetical protein